MLRFLGTSAPTLLLPLGLVVAAAWAGAAACGGSTTPNDGAAGVSDDSAATGGTSSTGGSTNSSGGTPSGTGGADAIYCVDVDCPGACRGTTCPTDAQPNGDWVCDTSGACTDDIQAYCGCDGATFQGSGSCPQRAFAHEGECDKVDCSPSAITCQTLVPPAACPAGQVHSVKDNCYGPCVPISQCACSSSAACPDPDQYVCHQSAGHCDYYVE